MIRVLHGDCREVLAMLPADSVDAVVTYARVEQSDYDSAGFVVATMAESDFSVSSRPA